MSSDLKLHCANFEVGTIKGPFFSDGTWYGTIEFSECTHANELERRVCNYVAFVVDWNQRIHRGAPADPSEFNPFIDLMQSGLWTTRDDNDNVTRITEAPVFFIGNELSWRTD
jgi:hypothetical protein